MDEKQYFRLLQRINSGRASKEEMTEWLEHTPKIGDTAMKKLVASGAFAKEADITAAIDEGYRLIQTSPEYKEKTLELAQDAEAGKLSKNVSQGLSLILNGVDIAQSVKQIRASNEMAKKSRKPSRPAIPQRDIYLQNALRSAEEGTMDAQRATAPLEAQIFDQYQSDVNDAKTASSGQSGAYGAYRQLASDRRNRSAMQIAPIQDEIRRGQQARYDNLLGMRAEETQNIFKNNASLYPYDLDQYNQDQANITSIGSQGRSNLRNSLYNFAPQAANTIGQNYTKRKYDQLRNQAMAAGLNPDLVEQTNRDLYNYSNMGADDSPQYWEQMYNG